MFNDYPYTDFNKINLDWLLETVKKLAEQSQGEPGEGVPTGGTTGQVLTKASNTDYDTEWTDVDTSDIEFFDVNFTLAPGGAYYNSDKTPAQIVAAITAGQTVRGIFSVDDATEYSFHLSYRPSTFDGEYYTEDAVSFFLMDGRTVSCEGNRSVWPFDVVVGQYDSQLSLYSSNAVENRVITAALQNIQPSQEDIQDAVDNWLDEHEGSIDGLSFEAKNALLALLRQVAYTVPNGEEYYAALENALIEGVTPMSISVSFNQGDTIIYDTDTLDTLRQYLTVTILWSDNTQTTTTDYTLSGNLNVGNSVITVTCMEMTDTFNVSVTARYPSSYVFTNGDVIKVNAAVTYANNRLYLSTDSNSVNNRRSFVLGSGDVPFKIGNTSNTNTNSQYYPIPIPPTATRVTVSITPATQYVGLRTLIVGGSVNYEDGFDPGWAQGIRTMTFEAGAYTHLSINCKMNSGGTAYTTEPTELTIQFS